MPTSNPTVAIVTPAYNAMGTLVATVRSVLAQTYPHWELVIVSDDGVDYLQFLAAHGIADTRMRQFASGRIGGGASAARNVALDAVTAPYVAILDADDLLKPRKLELAVAALFHHGIVTTALDVMDETFTHLRYVGAGGDLEMAPGAHKWLNLSMDSMIVWDRSKTDARYDLTMTNMTDLELLLQLYRTVSASFHLGTPLHDYVKRAGSMSNGDKTAAGMVASKTTLLERLDSGYYPLAPGGMEGMAAFLGLSLEAERHYGAALASQPGLLFEDHLEPRLQAKKQAAP